MSSSAVNQARSSCSSGAVFVGSPRHRVTRNVLIERSGSADLHLKRDERLNVDAELLAALPPQRLLRGLPRFQVTADEIPAVGVPPPLRMAVNQQRSPVAYEHRTRDEDRQAASVPREE